jgi:hypothetical protein
VVRTTLDERPGRKRPAGLRSYEAGGYEGVETFRLQR